MTTPTLEQNRAWRAKNSEKVNAYARDYRNGRLSALAYYKLERGCADCGYDLDPAALDFDHVRGQKLGHIAYMIRGNFEQLLGEIDKCEVVCANCHRVRTATRRRKTDEGDI